MKEDLSHLPISKQQELTYLVENIKAEIPTTEFIILFGSYADGDFVKYDQRTEFSLRTYYRSDHDLLILASSDNTDYFQNIQKINNAINNLYGYLHIKVTSLIQFVYESINDFNDAVKGGHYFYTEILQKGILLFDSGRCQLEEPHELDFEQTANLAEEYFSYRYAQAESFFKQAKYAYHRKDYRIASYEVHQAVESYLLAIILSATLYSPKGHDLTHLFNETRLFTDKAISAFMDSERLLQLLNSAYIQARHNKDFLVTKKDIEDLFRKTERLRSESEIFCENKINEYICRINRKNE